MKKIFMVAITLLAFSCQKGEIQRKDYRTLKIINETIAKYRQTWVETNRESVAIYFKDTCYHKCLVGDTLRINDYLANSLKFYTQKKGRGSFILTTDYTIDGRDIKFIMK